MQEHLIVLWIYYYQLGVFVKKNRIFIEKVVINFSMCY